MINALEYAKALFSLSVELGTEDEISSQLDMICDAVSGNPEIVTLLDTPAISIDEKKNIVDKSFAGANEMLMNFLKILCEKHSFFALPRCRNEFRACLDEARNIERATATSAVPIPQGRLDAMKKKLEEIFKKTIILENKVDPSLIGGVTLRVGQKEIDGSIKGKLDALKKSLAQTIV